MTTNYFRDMLAEEREELLATMEKAAVHSKRDGCWVVKVQCEECERMFDDELEAFKERFAGRGAMLCLGCDPEAIVPSFAGSTVKMERK